MAPLRKEIRLYRQQAEFCDSPALYRAFVGGIATGKSWVGSFDLICRARSGRTYMAVGPTYTSLQDSTLRSFLSIGRELGVIDPAALRMSAPPQLRLTTGAEILFRSGDRPEMLRGPNLSGIWLDEASLMPQMVHDIAIGRLREVGEQGWLSATFTPKGPTHWTYTLFGNGGPDRALIRARTCDNPFNPPDFAAGLGRQYGTSLFARQELEGDFVQLDGAVFDPTWFDHAGMWFEEWPTDLVVVVQALDPSKARTDASDWQAHVVAGLAADGTILAECELIREPVPQMVTRALSLCQRRRPHCLAVETNQGLDLLIPEFERQAQEQGLVAPIQSVENYTSKRQRIERLTSYFSRRQIRIRDTPHGRRLVNQIRDFPHGDHDDGPDALEIAVRMLELLSG